MSPWIPIALAAIGAASVFASGWWLGRRRSDLGPAPAAAQPEPLAPRAPADALAVEPTLTPIATARPLMLRPGVRDALAPLLGADDPTGRLDARVRELLEPALAGERVGRAVARLAEESSGVRALADLLDAMADRAGFRTVLVTDELGIPIGSSGGAAERAVALLPAAVALARAGTADGRRTVATYGCDGVTFHRPISSGGRRYVLTVVADSPPGQPPWIETAADAVVRALSH